MYKNPFYKNTSSSLRNKVLSDEESSSPSPIFPLLSPQTVTQDSVMKDRDSKDTSKRIMRKRSLIHFDQFKNK